MVTGCPHALPHTKRSEDNLQCQSLPFARSLCCVLAVNILLAGLLLREEKHVSFSMTSFIYCFTLISVYRGLHDGTVNMHTLAHTCVNVRGQPEPGSDGAIFCSRQGLSLVCNVTKQVRAAGPWCLIPACLSLYHVASSVGLKIKSSFWSRVGTWVLILVMATPDWDVAPALFNFYFINLFSLTL